MMKKKITCNNLFKHTDFIANNGSCLQQCRKSTVKTIMRFVTIKTARFSRYCWKQLFCYESTL